MILEDGEDVIVNVEGTPVMLVLLALEIRGNLRGKERRASQVEEEEKEKVKRIKVKAGNPHRRGSAPFEAMEVRLQLPQPRPRQRWVVTGTTMSMKGGIGTLDTGAIETLGIGPLEDGITKRKHRVLPLLLKAHFRGQGLQNIRLRRDPRVLPIRRRRMRSLLQQGGDAIGGHPGRQGMKSWRRKRKGWRGRHPNLEEKEG